jgi:hypothetical protein
MLEAGQLFGGEFAEAAKVGKLPEATKLAEGANDARKVFIPVNESGETLKTIKSAAGNTKIDAEARGVAHTQLREDASGNYAQRTTFDVKGRKRADTHFTTHGGPNKANPNKHTYYKMEEEHRKYQVNKYRIVDPIYDLSLLKRFIGDSKIVTLYGELEIEPFREFSLPFQALYWHLKYILLKNREVALDIDEHLGLFDEKDLNVIWLSMRNESNTVIECKDGEWFVDFSKQDEKNKNLLEGYKVLTL